MVASVVTENITTLKKAPQTFESIYTIIKNRFTSETFGEWLEDGQIRQMSYYELYERVDEDGRDTGATLNDNRVARAHMSHRLGGTNVPDSVLRGHRGRIESSLH